MLPVNAAGGTPANVSFDIGFPCSAFFGFVRRYRTMSKVD